VIAKGDVNVDARQNYALSVDTGNRPNCVLGNTTGFIMARSTTALAAQQFYHLACTWDGVQVRLYVDGVVTASVSQTITPTANTSPLYIGQYGGNVDRFAGAIDEVRVYNAVLTDAEIVTDMNTAVEAVPDVTPPTVSIANPPDGSQATGIIALVATASDDRVVAGVQFLLNDQPLGLEDTIEPFSTRIRSSTACTRSRPWPAMPPET
jgi:hypothetical protein